MKLKIKESIGKYTNLSVFEVYERKWFGWIDIALFYTLGEAENHCKTLLLEKSQRKNKELVQHTYELFGNKILKDNQVIETIQEIY